MAGSTLTVVMSNPYADNTDGNTIVLDWLSDDADGTVSIDIASTYATAQRAVNDALPQPRKIEGCIFGLETIPGENGDKTTACPTALYDITLDDPYSYDLAGGSLANRSATVAEKAVPSQPIPIDSEATLKISNAGNSKKGRIILYIKPEA